MLEILKKAYAAVVKMEVGGGKKVVKKSVYLFIY